MVPISSATIRKYPVTATVAIAAIAATVWGWHVGHVQAERLAMSPLAWHGQPWRLVTSTLYHLNPIHLLFDLYCLWVFGVWLEHFFGWWRTAAVYLLLAVGSGVAEYALTQGGVGLSGVGYGLFGLLWVLSRHDLRFAGLINRSVVQTLIGWFVLCIVLTAAKVWNIGNVAHGAGLLLGLLLGWTVVAKSTAIRLGRAAIMVLVLLGILAAGSVFRPYVNLVESPGYDAAYLADDALQHRNPERAIELYLEALAMSEREPRWWYNLGVAYLRNGQDEKAGEAFRQAHKLDSADPQYKKAAEAFSTSQDDG
jgi:membrane associated rhomboid family serine protease